VDDVAEAVAACGDEQGAVVDGGDGGCERCGVVGRAVASSTEVPHVALDWHVRDRCFTCVITGLREVRETAARVPQLAVGSPEL